jgi:hydroxypyruvate reductase
MNGRVTDTDARRLAREIFQEVAAHVDGAALVRGPATAEAVAAATHVLAVGKVAFPMLLGAGAGADPGSAPRPTLAIAPAPRVPAEVPLGVRACPADHPTPSARSVAAGDAALAFVRALAPGDRLLVLLSGGASALLCAPAAGLTLDEKRAATSAVSRGGAAIGALNAVRKHLSAIKGGRLALESRAPVTVLALSDVIGGEPATIGSGPFSPDPTTYADALDVVARTTAPGQIPEAARQHLERGQRGELPETPKRLAAMPAATHGRVAFLAAGTDDRDGDTPVSGGLVDGTTWTRIRAAGVDPQRALERWDSYTALAAAGDTVTGPGTSNVLDLHLLVVT